MKGNKLSRVQRSYANGGLSEVQHGIRRYLTQRYAFTIVKLRHRWHKLISDVAPAPFAVYTVDPDVIELYLEWERFQTFANAGRIVSGDWDRMARTLSSNMKYSLIRSYFNGETESGDLTRSRLIAHGYPEREAVRYAKQGYGDYLERLFKSIKQNGFRFQHRLSDDDSKRNRYDYIPVNIGRNGELIFDSSGFHRLAIAQIIGIDSIPVRINAIHSQWHDDHADVAAHPELTHIGQIP